MTGFRTPETPREALLLFGRSLDEAIPATHPVRLFDELLRSKAFAADFKAWEEEYHLGDGRPPYHPRYLAGVYLYGMMSRVRSSRQLEQACHNRIDVKWLMEDQTPDHATIAAFVKRHGKHLKQLFRTTIKVALHSGLVKLDHLAVDGTKVEADASGESVQSRATIEKKLAEVERQAAALEQEWQDNERREEALFGQDNAWVPTKSTNKLREQEQYAAKRRRLQDAIKNIDRRQAEASHGRRTKAIASTTDPDCRHMSDKKHNARPAYNAQIAVDGAAGIIVAEAMSDAACDFGHLPALLAQAIENAGGTPKAVLADSGYNTGADLAQLEDMKIESFMPDSGDSAPASPERAAAIAAAHAGQPLSPQQVDLLMDPQTKKLDRLAFRYDPEQNVYVCPLGTTLHRLRTVQDPQTVGVSFRGQYVAKTDCTGCPLAARCLSAGSARRMVTRDQYEDARNRLRARMRTPEGLTTYRKRGPTVETKFGQQKHLLGIRRFMHRGLTAVSAEWTAICTVLNLLVLIRTKKATKTALSLG